jgi:hypothetical protein
MYRRLGLGGAAAEVASLVIFIYVS